MVKATVKAEGDGFERKPWPDGEWVPFKIVKVEPRPKYNEPNETEISLTVTCLDGDCKDQWAYISVNHLSKSGNPNLVYDENGDPLSKWAKMLAAIRPDFDPSTDEADGELADFQDSYFMGFIEPANNPKYCKFLKFKKMDTKDIARYSLGATMEEVPAKKKDPQAKENLQDDIPF